MLVNTDPELADYCSSLKGDTLCAMDIEFMRRKTYKPVVSLIQIAGESNKPAIIDLLQVKDKSPIQALLNDRQCLKIFHSASQDIEILYDDFNSLPNGFFDTQIAGAFLGLGYSVS